MDEKARLGRRPKPRQRLAFGIHLGGRLWIAILLLLFCGAATLRLLFAAAPDPVIGGNFSLMASDGRRVTQSSFGGRYLLIYFGYSNCTDVCPQTLTELAVALGRLGTLADRVQPLFITVDPRRDTPQRLRSYLANFSPLLIGLTGTASDLSRTERNFHVVSRIGPKNADGGYDLDHSSVLYLVAPDQRIAALLPADAAPQVTAHSLHDVLAANDP